MVHGRLTLLPTFFKLTTYLLHLHTLPVASFIWYPVTICFIGHNSPNRTQLALPVPINKAIYTARPIRALFGPSRYMLVSFLYLFCWWCQSSSNKCTMYHLFFKKTKILFYNMKNLCNSLNINELYNPKKQYIKKESMIHGTLDLHIKLILYSKCHFFYPDL
jgi:hypothetical protein